MFFLVFFAIQIIGAQNNNENEVSSDGIAGARICGVFISAILLAFILGIYIYQIVNIVMVIVGIIMLTLDVWVVTNLRYAFLMTPLMRRVCIVSSRKKQKKFVK